MRVRFLEVAQKEVDDAVAWYDEQAPDNELGLAFLDEMDRSIRLITSFPTATTEIERGIRRCLLARFPYGLICGIDGDTIVVIAVSHLRREPRYWSDRIP